MADADMPVVGNGITGSGITGNGTASDGGAVDAVPEQIDRLQEVRPVWQMQGHEVCGDIHMALTVAQAVLTSRDERIAQMPDADSGNAVLRELRALGVEEAAPQLLAMVTLVDTAVDLVAEVGAMSEQDAWENIRKGVLERHCQAPRGL
jgi:hypothetical protein